MRGEKIDIDSEVSKLRMGIDECLDQPSCCLCANCETRLDRLVAIAKLSSPDISARVVKKLQEEIENLLDGDPDNGIRVMGIRTAISIIQSMSQSHDKEGV